MTKFIKDFRDFILHGNVVDMAVGIIIGLAFGNVVKSLVADIIMPPIGLVLGHVDFTNLFAVLKPGATPGPYNTLAAAHKAGAVTINYGLFINTVLNLVIIGFCVFLMVRAITRLRRPPAPAVTTRECPFCATNIPLKAQRCPNCISEIQPVVPLAPATA